MDKCSIKSLIIVLISVSIYGAEMPRMDKLPPGTNLYYFAATAISPDLLESVYSNEVKFTNVNRVLYVSLAWDSSCSNCIYKIYSGRSHTNYTRTFNAGTNLTITIPLYLPSLSNVILTITTTNGVTNIAKASSLKGPWILLNKTNVSYTNPLAPLYFRGKGKTNNRVIISHKIF